MSYRTLQIETNYIHLFLPTGCSSPGATGIPRLHLQYRLEEVIRCCCEETNLSIGMESVEVRALWRQHLIDEGVVAFVVRVGWNGEPRGKVYLSFKL